MQYCKRCLYPANHPLGITFDNEGVCSGCRIHEEKQSLDWDARREKLGQILSEYKNKSQTNFDCIVPVSGARDSYFIVHILKNVYKLNPLLVSYNKEYNTHLGIRNYAYLKTVFDCDSLTYSLNPEKLKKVTRQTLKKMGSMYWHCHAGTTTFPVQIAVKFKIPLIVWGVHQGIDQVGMFSHEDEVEMTEKYRKEHDLMGYDALDLLGGESELTQKDIEPFIYPSNEKLAQIGVRGIYLGNYIPWDAKTQHELMIQKYEYESSKQQRTFNTYDDVDCFHYSGLHDYIKFLKWGYGKVTDHAVREIRWQRMTRQEGIEHVQNYVHKKPQDLKMFLDWIQMPEEEFFEYIDQKRDPRIWGKKANGDWVLKDSIENDNKAYADVALEKNKESDFIVTPSKNPNLKDDHYIITDKGYVDYL